MEIKMNNLILLAKGTGFVDPVEGEGFAASWERFSGLGIQTFLLGMLTVFAVLSILWGCLEIFRYVFYTVPERNKANGGDKPASEPVAPVVPVVTDPEPAVYSDDGEVVAAIIAAITAMRSEEAAESGVAPTAFRVVSFRKRH